MHGEGHQAHADFGIEPPHGLHETDIAFLDEVGLGKSIAGVAPGEMDDEAHVAEHKLACRLKILIVVEAFREGSFILGAQYRERIDGLDIGFQVAARRQAR